MSRTTKCPECKTTVTVRGDNGETIAVHFKDGADSRPCPGSYKSTNSMAVSVPAVAPVVASTTPKAAPLYTAVPTELAPCGALGALLNTGSGIIKANMEPVPGQPGVYSAQLPPLATSGTVSVVQKTYTAGPPPDGRSMDEHLDELSKSGGLAPELFRGQNETAELVGLTPTLDRMAKAIANEPENDAKAIWAIYYSKVERFSRMYCQHKREDGSAMMMTPWETRLCGAYAEQLNLKAKAVRELLKIEAHVSIKARETVSGWSYEMQGDMASTRPDIRKVLEL